MSGKTGLPEQQSSDAFRFVAGRIRANGF